MQLRPYQAQAVEAVYEHLRRRDDNPCVVIPTAGGKTPVLATICRDAVQLWNGRVLIVTHVKELLEQAAEKLMAIAPDVPVGIYSAGLKRRDLGYAVTIAGIQSIYQKACNVGPVDLIIVDEAHLIPPDGEGMYRTFIADARKLNPQVRIIGLTATPYRMRTGTICQPDGILNAICYEVGIRELIAQGYLCPLRPKAGKDHPDTSKLHVRAGEFVAGEVEALMDKAGLVRSACEEIVELTADRHSVLIFAAGVDHAEHIQATLEQIGAQCGLVCGDTLPFERADTLRRFRSGELKYLANVNVLTTGFDAPNIDCVAILRPTLSPGLLYQMVGRGFRLHPGKTDCLVLDYGGNILRHGPIDQLQVREPSTGKGQAPAKECPSCHALIAAGYAKCPECGHEFPPPERAKHEDKATTHGVLSGQVTREQYEVRETLYSVHTKRNAEPDAPRTFKVSYRIGWQQWVSEWVCFEHHGYARQKALHWWRARSNDPPPADAEEAVELAEAGALARTLSITVEHSAGEYDRVVGHELGAIPPALESEAGLSVETGVSDDIPF